MIWSGRENKMNEVWTDPQKGGGETMSEKETTTFETPVRKK